MFMRIAKLCSAAALVFVLAVSVPGSTKAAEEDGIVRVKSAYSMGETIARLKQDIADKGIRFFDEVDQSKLAAAAGIKLRLDFRFYTDFSWIAHRHGIKDRDAAFNMATNVISSITSSVTAK